jgi:Cyclic nucleotide-binding domain/Major Facilitator Superfamily
VAGANRRLRLVQLARLASVTGRWAYTVTLAVYAYRSAGAGGVAVAGIVRLGPAAATAPFAGAVIQRARLDRLLLEGGLARTLALTGAGAVVLVDGPPAAVYTLVAVEAALSTLVRPMQNSLLPTLAQTPEELTSANLALSMIESMGAFLGPLAGAALLHGTSPGTVFVASAGAYLAAAVLLAPLRATAAAFDRTPPRSHFLSETLAGVRAVAGDRSTLVVVLIYGAQNVVAGALNILVVVTALRLLGMGQSGVGTLTASVGIGGVVGGGLVFARLRRQRHGLDLGLGLLLLGAPLVLLSLLSSRAAAFALLGVVGVGVTIVDVASITLLQRNAKGDLLPHALALLQTVFVLTVGTGTLLAPLLVSELGVRGALFATGAPLPLLAFVLTRRLRGLDERPPEHVARIALLAGIPIFSPLTEAALEHLAAVLRPRVLGGGQTVFEQGDEGDEFYVVEEGEVEVRKDGERVATLGPGGYFGEIALLRDVPRTASIRTLGPARLLGLERGRFLATVTGNAASSDAADAIVGARIGLRAGFTSL